MLYLTVFYTVFTVFIDTYLLILLHYGKGILNQFYHYTVYNDNKVYSIIFYSGKHASLPMFVLSVLLLSNSTIPDSDTHV